MNIKIGSQLEFENYPPITQDQLRRYAEASGDLNPIHLNPEAAKKAGLPGVIAHGMLSAAFVAERARSYAAQEPDLAGFKVLDIQIRFRAMVLLGDSVRVGGSIKQVSTEEVTLEIQAKNQRGELVIAGTVGFRRGVR